MLKVILTVCAIISSIIAITLYSTTLPAVQKQSADNAAAIEQNAEAIETLGGSVSDNTEAIETIKETKIYEHNIILDANNAIIRFKFISNIENYSTDTLIEYLKNNEFTNYENAIMASGRYYYDNSSVLVYGLYTDNEDFYALFFQQNDQATISYLLQNVSVTDISVLIN